MNYLGDFAEDATLDFKWSSNGADGTSITRATDGTIAVYIGNGTTQVTAGVTDTEDFDSVTGIHHCRVDLSADAAYVTGSECQVVLSGSTIDGITVNAVLAHFSIERTGGVLALLKGANGLSAIKTETASIQTDTNDIQTRIPAALVSGRMDSSVGAMAANVLTAAATAADFTTEIQTGLATAAALATVDGIVDDILVDTAEIGAAGAGLTALASAANLATLSGFVDTEVAAILADTNELQTDWANGGRLDNILDARASQASVDTIDGIVDSILIDTAEIGAAGAGLTALASASALATVDTVVDAIKVTTDKLDTTVEATSDGYHFTANALEEAPTGGSAPTVGEIADEVQTRTIAAVTVVNGLAANVITAAATAGDFTTEIQAGLATSAALATVDTVVDAIKVTTDKLDTTVEVTSDATYIFTVDALANGPSGSGSSPSAIADEVQTRTIAAVTLVNGLAANVITAAATAADFTTEIQAGLATSAALATVDGIVDAILVDTDELQTDWVNGGRLDNILDARSSQASVDTIDGIVDSILVDTAEIGAAGAGLTALASAANLATVDTVVDSIKVTTDKLDGMVENTSDGWIWTVVALQNAPTDGVAPTASAIADAVWDEAVDGSYTARQSIRVQNSLAAGKSSGHDTLQPVFRDISDTKDRVSGEIDEFGNRTSVTVDAT